MLPRVQAVVLTVMSLLIATAARAQTLSGPLTSDRASSATMPSSEGSEAKRVKKTAQGNTSAKITRARSGAKPDADKKAASKTPPELWRLADPDRAAPAAGQTDPQPSRQAVVSHAKPVDPIELGGKWNGANDDASKTRVQNYNGDATGTGGEVGLKLHF